MPEMIFLRGTAELPNEAASLHIVLLMLIIYCAVMTKHKPAVYVSLNAKLSYHIQQQQGTKRFESNFHAICVFCAKSHSLH